MNNSIIIKFLLLLNMLFFSNNAFSTFPSLPGENPWDNKPNDPSYSEQWHFFSHLPLDHIGSIPSTEVSFGSGVSIDKAWQYSLGSKDTLIAILDSGVEWSTEDLLERYYLNKKELPLPEGSLKYDKNNDNEFTVSDYLDDSRVFDKNKNGVIDPEDLILIFSNGIDEDQNGFVDDISGWDFLEFDNDPYDRNQFKHGTDQGLSAVGTINNGVGRAGACGKCSVIYIRHSDSFIVDANSFASSIYYAVNIGADLISQANGGMNFNNNIQEAVNYAYDRNVVVIGTAGDENSYHHNLPSYVDPIIYVNAVRFNSLKPQQASTFLNLANCTNYGARVDFSVAAEKCSSEATSVLTGLAGLALSYSKEIGISLSAGELISLLKTSTRDVNLGSNEKNPTRYSTWKGWDTITGYGRIDGEKVLKRIHNLKLPSEARIIAPQWFDVFTAKDEINFSIRALNPRSGKSEIKIEVTHGVETSKSNWKTLKVIKVSAEGFEGDFVKVKASELFSLSKNKMDLEHNKDSYTFKLTVNDLKGQVAEARRTIIILDDSYLKPGYPKKLKGSGESNGLFFDLDRDGKQEYITADGNGFVHAFTINGNELDGFPAAGEESYYQNFLTQVTEDVFASIVAPIAVGDLDNNGFSEIVTVSLEGGINVFQWNGLKKKGFPVFLPKTDFNRSFKGAELSFGVIGAPVLADLDNDSQLEIIIVSLDGYLYVYNQNGQIHDGFPVEIVIDDLPAKLLSSPVVYDLDDDGYKDIIFGSNHVGKQAGHVFAISGKGYGAVSLNVPGFPVKIPVLRDVVLPTFGIGIPTAPILADIDGDGIKEIMIHPFIGKTYMISLDGIIKKSLSTRVGKRSKTIDKFMISAFGAPGVADVDGDGIKDFVTLGAGKRALTNLFYGGSRVVYENFVGAWSGKTGKMLDDFPIINNQMELLNSPVFEDFDGDGADEIIVGSSGHLIHSFTKSGETEGFPHNSGGWIFGSASLGDLDGDGYTEVAITTREGYLFIWDSKSQSNSSLWNTAKGNSRRTGVLEN